jgi:hypothetical protein
MCQKTRAMNCFLFFNVQFHYWNKSILTAQPCPQYSRAHVNKARWSTPLACTGWEYKPMTRQFKMLTSCWSVSCGQINRPAMSICEVMYATPNREWNKNMLRCPPQNLQHGHIPERKIPKACDIQKCHLQNNPHCNSTMSQTFSD